MQRLVILTEEETQVQGPTPLEDLNFPGWQLIEALPPCDIAATRSGHKLRVFKNRWGPCGVIRMNGELEALLDGTWKGVAPLEHAKPPLLHSFETFVEWKGNRLALEAAKSMAHAPKDSYGGLARISICGGSGTGKTHLLASIWQAVKHRDPSTRVAYLTASTLFERMCTALKTGGLPEFEQDLCEFDVLLIDQGEALALMERSQNILKEALDAASERGAAVVFAWNGAARSRDDWQEPFRDRLSGFLPIRLDPPEGDEGREFLRSVLNQYTQQTPIPERWANWLVSRSRGRIRTLQGLLARLQFECRVHQLDLHEENASNTALFEAGLKDFLDAFGQEECGDK